MKKILPIITLLICSISHSQDSTIVTLSIKARLVQTLTPFVRANDDTASVNLMNRWIKKYEVTPNPSGTTQISVDSIATTVVAALYSKALSWPQGAPSVGNDFASDINAIRTANSYLDRLCDAIDLAFTNELNEARLKGRKLLTGRN